MTQDEIEARGEFTPRTQGEIDRNLFAARTGALVQLSAGALWELLYPAQAWHRHVKAEATRVELTLTTLAMKAEGAAELARIRATGNPVEGHLQLQPGESYVSGFNPLAPQARDTTPSDTGTES